jgi:hypothetical protein
LRFSEDFNGEQQQQLQSQQQQSIIACPLCGVALEAVAAVANNNNSGTTAAVSSLNQNIMMQLNGVVLAVQPNPWLISV